MWRPVAVQAHVHRRPANGTLAIDGQAHQPAGRRLWGTKAIEHEIAQAVDDRAASVDLGVLGHMGMPPDHGIGADIDQPSTARATWVYSGMPIRMLNGNVTPRLSPKYSAGLASGIA